jgi:predicted RNA-binding Zn-ribbon protein involved in translation (DUF1610 family)
MGMYDNIRTPDIKCPHCGEVVTGFQSKDADCALDTLDYWEVDNFYTSCVSCGTWLEFYRKTPRQYLPIEAYELDYTDPDERKKEKEMTYWEFKRWKEERREAQAED